MIFFVTGGSGSGKSEYAEQLAVKLKEEEMQRRNASKEPSLSSEPRLIYIATMEPMESESWQRVHRHRAMRAGKKFETREQFTHLEELTTSKNEILMLECLSNLMANEMFSPEGRKESTAEMVERGICFLAKHCLHMIVVGNNVFEDGMKYDDDTLRYLRETAKVHEFLGRHAHCLTEVICGIPVEWKKE